jgi:PAS domain S-box-containing protein
MDTSPAAVAVNDTYEEVTALVRLLHETQSRLQVLGGGELDAVLHPGGQSYLLHDAQERLRRSEALQRDFAATQSSILNALPAHIALINRSGKILSVNDGWRDFAAQNGVKDFRSTLGENYLEICDQAKGKFSEEARAAAAGIRAVLQGESAEFSLEYPCHGPTEKRWFRLTVRPMRNNEWDGAVVMHVNVTERKLADEVLRESEERFRGVFRGAAIGIAISSPHGGYLQANAAYCAMLGYTEEELLKRDFASVTHPDDLADNLKVRDEMLSGERDNLVMEKRYLRKDGEIVWTRASVSAVHAPTGEIATLIVVAENITERKKAQESLLLFRTLIDQSIDAIEVVDPETLRYLDFNESACKRLGYTREELLALAVPDIDPDVSPATWELRFKQLQAAGSVSFESSHRSKDGSIFPVEINLRNVKLDRCYIVASVRDITERKRTEARFRRLISSNAQGVIFWNAAGEITVANDAFLNLVRHTRADLEAGRINWVKMTPPEYAHLDRNALVEITAKGVCSSYEKELNCGDGSRVSVLLGAAAFEDNPDEGVCFFIDLTERKELEMQFLRAQRMESIGTLAGGIAHDLNNTLSPIIMSLDILGSKFTDPDSEHLLDIISSSARRGANMVRQVLSFARGVEGERKEMQIKHLVYEIDNIIRDTFPKNVRMSSSVPNDLWTILGDATQLHQVLLNLCVNARDAMPSGGKIVVSAENLIIDDHAAGMNPDAHPGNYVFLKVEDNGAGISPVDLERIFDPFFTTKPIDKGTGLGLSTSVAIVKSHGGFMRVHSELGKGTEFTIHLPAITEVSSVAPAEKAVEMPCGHNELILVVDDEEAVRVITQRTLENFGYRAIVAKDGADALATYAKRQAEIAAVLTDMMMPIMDGLAVIQVLRRINPRLPIIAASGLSASEHIAEAANLGVHHFLSKPFSTEQLLTTLRQVLEEGDCAPR